MAIAPLRFFSLLACLALAGCGFHLRGSEGDKTYAQNLYIDGPGKASSFFGSFASALTGAGGQMTNAAAGSSGVVYLYRASYFRQPITLSRSGLATGYDLSYRVVYEVRGPKGEVLQPRKELEVKRDYFNDQSLPLAQLSEEGLIREELEKEAAQTLLRKVGILLNPNPTIVEPSEEPEAPEEPEKPEKKPEDKS